MYLYELLVCKHAKSVQWTDSLLKGLCVLIGSSTYIGTFTYYSTYRTVAVAEREGTKRGGEILL